MKNIDYINKKKSSELGFSVDIVSKVNSYYWDTVKSKMRSLENERIYVKELGSFDVSPFKLSKYIERLRTIIKNLRKSTKFKPENKEIILRRYKDTFKKCMEMQRKAAITLDFKKNYRNEYKQSKRISEASTEGDSPC